MKRSEIPASAVFKAPCQKRWDYATLHPSLRATGSWFKADRNDHARTYVGAAPAFSAAPKFKAD